MKLTDLKIGTQLKIAFGIILLLIVLLGTISRQMNDRLAEQTTMLAEHPFKVTNAVRKLDYDIMAMRLEFRNYLLAPTKEEKQQAISNSDIYEADAQNQFDILFNQYLGPREDIENARNAFLSWVLIRKSNRDETNVKDAFSRIEPTGDIGTEREKLLQAVKKIEVFAFNKADQLIKISQQTRRSQNLSLGILMSLILIVVIVVIFSVNGTIRRPIVELANVNKLFMEGNRSIRSEYSSNSELGHLAKSFNLLAKRIESELSMSEKSAMLAELMLSEDDTHRFCHSLLNGLMEQTGAQMGAVYLLNNTKTEFERFECIGMGAEECKSFSATNFEGEFGLALSTQNIQYITQIPENSRFLFYTVAGKFIPREIITIPIVVRNETVAVISMVSIKNFKKESLTLLENVRSMLCARMGGILAHQKIIEFANQLEEQKNILEAQKAELHIMNKELAAKTETLAAANSELVEQRRELSEQARELTTQNVELEVQKKYLDESNKLKTTFLSNMSHELRTPLNSVIALSGVLSRRLTGNVPEEEYSYLNVIERNGKQLLSLINEILDLSRIESGREEISINLFNPNELIGEVVELIHPQATAKGIELQYKTEDGLPYIESDYVKCRHIIQNLVSNAVKFTENGGVAIDVKADDRSIRIIVADSGIGIDKKHLPFIFDEFRQGDGSNSRKFGGTGLGLAIAKKYTEMLGGKIEVKSQPGEGSVFTLILPLKSQSAGEVVEHFPVYFNAEPGNMDVKPASKNILIVEDSESAIIQIKDILEHEGYNVRIAHNGSEALAQISEAVPDGMILDLMMPGVDGFEVLRRIRQQEITAHLPVIILTAKYITKSDLAFLKHNSVFQLIQKGDINKEQLLNTLSKMMFYDVSKKVAAFEKPIRQPISGKPRILVVEDNLDNMVTIKALLDGKCHILEAEDGWKAVEMAKEHNPDLILMDIALPGINGIEAMNEIRKEERLEAIPILAVSASAMKGDREDFIALGFDGYISKPIDHYFLEKTISEFLN